MSDYKEFMLSMQRPLARIICDDLSIYHPIEVALGKAGWDVCRGGGASGEQIALTIVDGRGAPADDPLHLVGTIVPGGEDFRGADFSFDPQDGIEKLTSLLASWLLPDVAPLDRLAALFGEAEFLPLAKGLRSDLIVACGHDHLGATSAHRLAGLSGTLGFAALSRAWASVDAGGGDVEAAERESRKAAVAITLWLAGRE